jgi:tRNA threonylcarbamoyladenosine biosynthesis protein TsaB
MILALETATAICGAALIHQGEVISSLVLHENNVHAEKLMPLVEQVLTNGGISLEAVEGIAVSIGPGSFTGLRIGLSTAKGLAFAADKQLIAVPTLDALTEAYCAQSSNREGIICPLIDAKRDEAFFAFYHFEEGNAVRTTEYAITSLAEIIERSPKNSYVTFIGDGVSKMTAFSSAVKGVTYRGEIICDPAAVARCAEKQGQRYSRKQYATLEPLYLRDFIAHPAGRPKVSNINTTKK